MDSEARFAISDLADEASVSVRTVRYYISEGLLPPAVTAGARSYYTRDHLDRLRLIGRMKEGFLPLREIRKQLTELDDESVRRFAGGEDSEMVEIARPPAPPPSSYFIAEQHVPSAQALGFIHGREDIRSSKSEPEQTSSAASYISSVLKGSIPRRRTSWTYSKLHVPDQPIPEPSVAPATAVSNPTPSTPGTEAAAWRRIAMGDGAELLIREDAYQRRRDKIEWLVDWARKVLD